MVAALLAIGTAQVPELDLPVSSAWIQARFRATSTGLAGGVVTPDGKSFFSGSIARLIERYDKGSAVFRNELLHVGAADGARLFCFTTSQSQTIRPGGTVSSRELLSPLKLRALSAESVLVATSLSILRQDGFLDGAYELYGVSIVNVDKRGPAPNVDATFPRSGEDEYRVLASEVVRDGIDLLVGRGSRRLTNLEGYRFSNGRLTKQAAKESSFSGFVGKAIEGYVSEVDTRSGRALVGKAVVDVTTGKQWPLPPLAGQTRMRFAGSILYATVDPHGHTGIDDHRLCRLEGDLTKGTAKWRDLGPYSLLGSSPDGKTLALQASKSKELWLVVPK